MSYDDFDSHMAQRFIAILSQYFTVKKLRYQVQHKNENSWAYINFLRIGNCIILPGLGAEEDKQAFTQIQGLYPECKVLQIEATEVVNKGGALNCITWNIKEQINL